MRALLLIALTCLIALGAAAPARAIVGGEPARGEFPFFTQLIFDGDANCGGALVRPQWVLTAAHCVLGLQPGELDVIVGSRLRGDGERIAMRSAKVHPGFLDESIPALKAAWDVAVVELEQPVDAPLIGFAQPAEFAAGTQALAIGLGADGFATGSYRDELYQAALPIASDEECATTYAGRYDPDQHICAGTFENETATCQGDSGGPLMIGGGAAWKLVGTVSFGTGCGGPGAYSVFARAAGGPLRTWLEQQLPPLPAPPQPGPAMPSASPASPPAAAQRPAFRLTVSRVRRGARSVTVRVGGPAQVLVRDGRGRTLGRARAARAGAVVVRLRRPARPGRLTVRAGGVQRTVRVR